jgi:hypothetical protein
MRRAPGRLAAVSRPRTLTTLAAAALAAAAAVPASLAAAPAPRLVDEGVGLTRQVSLGDRIVAWTRCLGGPGPTEIRWAPVTRGPARRVPAVRAPGTCDGLQLVGTWGTNVLALIPGGDGLRRLVQVDARTGARVVLDAETPGAAGVRIAAADADGPRVAWLRESGAGAARVSEATVTDLRRPGVRAVRYARSLRFGAVRPTGVWISPRGALVVREILSGALYGYGERDERLLLVRGGTARQVARLATGGQFAAADISARWLVYSYARAGDRRVWVTAYSLTRGTRRVVRVARLLPAGAEPVSPAVPAPSAAGDVAGWRERLRAPGGYADRVVAVNLARRRSVTVVRIADTSGQRRFTSQPSLRGARAAWAQASLSTAYGVAGGFLGETPVGARSRLSIARVR